MTFVTVFLGHSRVGDRLTTDIESSHAEEAADRLALVRCLPAAAASAVQVELLLRPRCGWLAALERSH